MRKHLGIGVPFIKVVDVLYKPMSHNTYKNRNRMDILSDLAYELDIDIERLTWEFGKYLAGVISLAVTESIRTQKIGSKRMKHLYKPLSDKYKKRKNPKHKDDFWVDTGFLAEHISVYHGGVHGDLYVGIPASVKYTGSGVPVKNVIRYLERGTRTVPARPLFTPILKQVSKNIDTLFNQFISVVKERGGL